MVQVPVTGGGGTEDISAQITAALPPSPCGGGGGGGGGSPGSPNGSAQFNNASALGGDAQTLYASAFTGSDWVAKVEACLSAVETNGGGTCDAKSLAGSTSSSTLTVGDATHTVNLLLGPGVYTANNYLYRSFAGYHGAGAVGSFNPPATVLYCSQPTANRFTATISGTTMTVTAVAAGQLSLYQTVKGPGVTYDSIILSVPAGGGVGTYTLTQSSTVSSGTAMTTANACISGADLSGSEDAPTVQGIMFEPTTAATQGDGSVGSLLGGTNHVDTLDGVFTDVWNNGFDIGTALYSNNGCICYNIFDNVSNTGNLTASIQTLNFSGYPFGINSNLWIGGKQWGAIGLWDTNGLGNTWDGVMDLSTTQAPLVRSSTCGLYRRRMEPATQLMTPCGRLPVARARSSR